MKWDWMGKYGITVLVSVQKKLEAANVLVVGAGGLGSPVVLYLAGSGIGKHSSL